MEEIDSDYSGATSSTPTGAKPENPPAFPGIAGESGHGNATRTQAADGETVWVYHNQGMTLRDYFAAHAPIGLAEVKQQCLAQGMKEMTTADALEWCGKMRYLYADAMLAARPATATARGAS